MTFEEGSKSTLGSRLLILLITFGSIQLIISQELPTVVIRQDGGEGGLAGPVETTAEALQGVQNLLTTLFNGIVLWPVTTINDALKPFAPEQAVVKQTGNATQSFSNVPQQQQQQTIAQGQEGSVISPATASSLTTKGTTTTEDPEDGDEDEDFKIKDMLLKIIK